MESIVICFLIIFILFVIVVEKCFIWLKINKVGEYGSYVWKLCGNWILGDYFVVCLCLFFICY